MVTGWGADGSGSGSKNQNFKICLETFLERKFCLKTIFYWFLAQFQSGVDSHIFPLGFLKEFHVYIHKIENHHKNVKKNRFDTILGPRMWKNIKRNILEYTRVLQKPFKTSKNFRTGSGRRGVESGGEGWQSRGLLLEGERGSEYWAIL